MATDVLGYGADGKQPAASIWRRRAERSGQAGGNFKPGERYPSSAIGVQTRV